MRPRLVLVFVTWFTVAIGFPVFSQDTGEAVGVRALLELSQEFFYIGDPLQVRISIGNEGPDVVKNPVKSPLFSGFHVRRLDRGALEKKAEPSVAEPERPDRISPMGFYGAVVDLSEIFPDLNERGRFEIHWSADGVESARLVVQMIPKYDPTRHYVAEVETDEGPFVIDFYPESSPIAVKAFVDMANAGFYDGLLFYEVRPNLSVSAGDPQFGGPDRRPILFPAEQSSVPVVAGTVVMRPVGAAPPANSSPFMVVLRPQPNLAGQVTVLGQVSKGLDVIKRISAKPSSQKSSTPHFKPLKDIRLLRITVSEKTAGAAPKTISGN